jgi:hypothetical protein
MNGNKHPAVPLFVHKDFIQVQQVLLHLPAGTKILLSRWQCWFV